MKTYRKYIRRDLKKLVFKLVAIAAIVTLGVGISVGLYTAAPNMQYSVEKYYDETNAADIILQGNPFDKDFVDDFKNNPLIDEACAYFSFDNNVDFQNGSYLAKINIINFDDQINKLKVVEGRLPNSNGDIIEIVVERKQPFLIEVPLGYETPFLDKTVRVVGIVQSPWYFAFVEEISHQKQRPIEVIIYANDSLVDGDIYTHINATLKGARDFETFSDEYEKFVDDKIEILEQEYSEYYFTTRNLNQSFAKYKSDIKIIEAIALIFPLFFLLVTVLVSMSSVTRIVEDQRTQIGTLRSLGFGKFRILTKYLLYSLLASGVGAILGIGLGFYPITAAIYSAYKTIYNLPELSIQYYWQTTAVISLIMILSVAVITIISVLQTLKERTTDLLKIKTQKPGKKIIFERIPIFWKMLKFKYKSTLRNIFRHKKNLILTLIGISGSTALLLTGFGIKDAIELAGKYQYHEMMLYDAEININNGEGLFPEISEYESTFIMSANAQYLNKSYITIVIPKSADEINNFIAFGNDNKEITFDSKSVLLTKQFASKHNLKVGNQFSLTIQEEEVNLEVTGIQEYYFGNNIYISRELIPDQIDVNYNKIYLKTGGLDDVTKQQLSDDLANNVNVVKILYEEDLKYSFENTSKSLYSVIILLVIFSSALAIIINYNLILINIHTRKREIATLKVLGYQETEVSGYVFRETLIISSVAILIGLLLGKILHYFIISRIVIDGVLLFNSLSKQSYIYTTIMSFVFLVVVYLMSTPQTKKIDMIDALKSFE